MLSEKLQPNRKKDEKSEARFWLQFCIETMTRALGRLQNLEPNVASEMFPCAGHGLFQVGQCSGGSQREASCYDQHGRS